MKNRVYRLKWKNIIIAISVIVVLIVLLINPVKMYHKSQVKKLNYVDTSASAIVKLGLTNTILEHEYSDFVNRNISDENFNVDYINEYLDINYDGDIKLLTINKLIDIGYEADDINNILASTKTGNIDFILNHSKYDKISEYLKFNNSKLENIDRYVEYKASNVVSYKDCVTYVNLGLDYKEYENATTVNEFSYTMLVNKHFMLNETFVPENLEKIPDVYGYSGDLMEKQALDAYIEMYEAMFKENGLRLYASNGYRSYEGQMKVYANAKNKANSFKEGSSEHQTGLAISIGSRKTDDFAKSKEKSWLDSNAYKYGFIYRFPTNKEEITGFGGIIHQYRYVGKEAAKVIYDNKLTLEEYYSLYVDIK